MIDRTVARRYAKALLEVARGENSIEPIATQIQSVADTIGGHSDLSKILYGGLFSVADRKAILDKIGGKLGVSKSVHNFLFLLIDKDRLRYLPEIAKLYRAEADEMAGRARARIISAAALDKAIQEKIAAELGRYVDRKVECVFETNAALLGGIRAEIGSTVLDGTLRAQLERLTQALQQG